MCFCDGRTNSVVEAALVRHESFFCLSECHESMLRNWMLGQCCSHSLAFSGNGIVDLRWFGSGPDSRPNAPDPGKVKINEIKD